MDLKSQSYPICYVPLYLCILSKAGIIFQYSKIVLKWKGDICGVNAHSVCEYHPITRYKSTEFKPDYKITILFNIICT